MELTRRNRSSGLADAGRQRCSSRCLGRIQAARECRASAKDRKLRTVLQRDDGQLAGSSATSPSRRARSSRFLTEEADHFALPRGVRSCRRSSWPAMSRSDRSGLDCEIPATRVIRRSSGGRGDARFSSVDSARCSVTSHLTARRSRSGVQSRPRCFRTRAMSSQLWSGRIRRTVGSHWFIVDCSRRP